MAEERRTARAAKWVRAPVRFPLLKTEPLQKLIEISFGFVEQGIL